MKDIDVGDMNLFLSTVNKRCENKILFKFSLLLVKLIISKQLHFFGDVFILVLFKFLTKKCKNVHQSSVPANYRCISGQMHLSTHNILNILTSQKRRIIDSSSSCPVCFYELFHFSSTYL